MSHDPVLPIQLTTEDGQHLEGELLSPADAAVGVVITHPHPTYGGSMHTPVPAALFRRCQALGVAGLRFNFRGVGASTGVHDEGRAEQLDVVAALDEVADRVAGPVAVAGWSFGADVALAVDHDRLAAWMSVAAPLSVIDPTTMAAAHSPKPKLLVVPAHDQFRQPDAAKAVTSEWPNTEVDVVPGADHYLAGGLETVADALERLLGRLDTASP